MAASVDSLTVETTLTAATVQVPGGADLNTHAARHAPGGADAIAVAGTVMSVGTANSAGDSANFARGNHVHQGVHSLKANAGGTQRFGDLSIVSGNGTSVTDDGSGNMTVDTQYGANEFKITSTAGLQINYTGGRFVNGLTGAVSTIPSGSITVNANVSLGYLYVALNALGADGTVTAATTPPPLNSIPFATFISNASAVTTTNDIRAFVNPVMVSTSLRVTYPGTGLTVNYNSGAVRINGTMTTVAAGSIALTDNTATGGIYVDVDGVVKQNTTGVFPPNSVPLATYTTNASAVTALGGQRTFLNNNIVFGTSGNIAALTPTSTASAGSTNRFADAGHVHALAIGTQNASATTQTTTTSTSDTALNGMSITPGAGTYVVLFNCSCTHVTNTALVVVSVYENGVQVADTEQSVTPRVSNQTYTISLVTHGVATVAAGQAIEIRWRTNTGTATMNNRRMTLIKVG